jgi:thymidylate synthase
MYPASRMTSMEVVETRTLGEGWLEVSRRILEAGADATYDGQVTKELSLVTLAVAGPDPEDELIASLADPDWLDWMRRNFTQPDDVAELGGARSYARRLRDYDGRDQVAWVIERLRADPETRSATITTFQPLADTSYIPCVSLLDFWIAQGRLELVVYAHSLDFGKKAYGNLVELAHLQEHVAGELAADVGRLVVHVKTAHLYEPEWAAMAELARVAIPAAAQAQ